MSVTRGEVLDLARRAVLENRAAARGPVEDSFGQIAAIWSARLGVGVTSAQVAIMMIDLKTVRAWSNPGHDDNWVDIAGYAACGGEVAAGVTAPKPEPKYAFEILESLESRMARRIVPVDQTGATE